MALNLSEVYELDFNSIKVQLEPSLRPLLARCTCTFQFHKGTIRTQLSSANSPPIIYFNSIKVQLELDWKSLQPLYKLFQFHKGTIRTFAPLRTSF